jgi:hypothetical protein
MIQVIHNGKLVSIINYGWESATFYENWMGSSAKDNSMPKMHGASIDIMIPDLVGRDGMLALFNALLNGIWIAKIKRHYDEVKSAMSERTK